MAGGVREWVRRVVQQKPGSASLRRYARVVAAAGEREDTWRELADDELTARVGDLRGSGPFSRDELAEVCAAGREVARRALDERPFDVQLLGVLGLLNGYVVEMGTGEGKTLAGALAAAGYALRGRRVHVVAVNDYLARRDAEWMHGVYERFGVTVGWVGQQSDPAARRAAYACDVTYVPVSELGFDVLRDRLRTEADARVVGEPDVALVDEADSVLVDEALVPLVLAGAVQTERADAELAALVRPLRAGTHYEVDAEGRVVSLTDDGLDEVERTLGVDLYAEGNLDTLTGVNLALQAEVLLRRDVDYLVRDGNIELINAARGRVARLQRWPDGLQAAVEAKEGIAASEGGEVLDSIIVQTLLGRYATVCGMSGTSVAVAEALAEFYTLTTARVPPNLPCVRDDEPDRLYTTTATKRAALIEYVREVHETGRPILIGTRSVAESEELAGHLADAGVPGAVLNAKNDAEEAGIIAHAGEHGQVTISTQMAGRGTDIRLGGPDEADRERIAELGGLCVVGLGRHHTSRLDDQLRGRAGRQGDPGGSVLFTSMDDDLLAQHVTYPPEPKSPDDDGRVHDRNCAHLLEHAQRVAEGVHLEIHRNTWRYHQLLTTQRDTLLRYREAVLTGTEASTLLRGRCPQRWAELADDVSDDVLTEAARQIVLFHLDACWSEHIAHLTDVREGIHLRAIARQTPIDEFHRLAIEAFGTLRSSIAERSAESFTEATITADGLDLAASHLDRPTSTWTYLVNDNPFGAEGERFLEFLGDLMRGKDRTPTPTPSTP